MSFVVANQRGGVSLSVILSVVLGLGLAASAYLNVYQHQRSEDDRKLMQGQITDLRYQVQKDRESTPAASVPATPAPLATPEPSPTPTPTVAGTSSISISQFGIKLTVTDPIADLTYDMVQSGAYQVAALSTRSLISKYAACKPSSANSALGFLVRKKAAPGVTSQGELIKQAGVYNYYYIKPTSFCASGQSGRDALAAARAAVRNAALPTLSN